MMAKDRAEIAWDEWVRENDQTHKPVGVGGFELLTPTEVAAFKRVVADACHAHAAAARLEERKRCAKVADRLSDHLVVAKIMPSLETPIAVSLVVREIAAAIRALPDEEAT